MISRRLGNLVDAKETLGWAARSLRYRSSAYCQIAEIYFQESRYSRSLEYAKRSLEFNIKNLNALQIRAAAYRKLQQFPEAVKVIEQILEIEPLNHMARFELYLLQPNSKKLENFRSMIRSEFSTETYMEISLYSYRLGLSEEAFQLYEFI